MFLQLESLAFFAADTQENGEECERVYEDESQQIRNIWENAISVH